MAGIPSTFKVPKRPETWSDLTGTNQWNSGQITWPFAGSPPSGPGNVTADLPGKWMTAPAAQEPPIPPTAFGNWPWANAYFYSGTVITPCQQTAPPGHAGVVVSIYRMGVLTWWQDIQVR